MTREPIPVSAEQDFRKTAEQTLAVIKANQRRFAETRSLRKQYRICMENEALFSKLGFHFPPMRLPGLLGWWIKFRQPSPQRTDLR
jgi:hypothetical protein